jgi:hypothetical protein
MQLLSAWKESLSLIFPPNGILFILVSLKAIVRTYKAWLLYFGWFFVGLALVDAFFSTLHLPGFVFTGPFSVSTNGADWLRFVGWYFLVFTVYLCARPSVLPKSVAYFVGYLKHFVLFLCTALFFSWLNLLIIFTLYASSPVHMYNVGMSFLLVFYALFSWTRCLPCRAVCWRQYAR